MHLKALQFFIFLSCFVILSQNAFADCCHLDNIEAEEVLLEDDVETHVFRLLSSYESDKVYFASSKPLNIFFTLPSLTSRFLEVTTPPPERFSSLTF